MKSYSDNKQETFQPTGNNYQTYYRWNHKQVTIQAQECDRLQWECDEVLVPYVSYETTVQVVINELWNNDVEKKLINDYAAANLGIYTGNEATLMINNYKQFLNDRKTIKEIVRTDCNDNGIR